MRLDRVVKRSVGTLSVWWEYADAKYERTEGHEASRERAHMRIISCRSSTVICDTKRGDGKGDRNVSRVVQQGTNDMIAQGGEWVGGFKSRDRGQTDED